MTQVLAGGAVDDDDAAIAVAVGNEGLVGFGIDPDARRSAQERRIGAAADFFILADLQQEFAVARELHHAVAAVAADPDVVLVIDEQPVRVARPVREVAERSLAPALHELALRIELENRRRSLAARTKLYRLRLASLHTGAHLPGFLVELFFGQRLGQMRDPDMLLRVHEDAGHGTHDPVIGHFLRPVRIDLEGRNVGSWLCLFGCRPVGAQKHKCRGGCGRNEFGTEAVHARQNITPAPVRVVFKYLHGFARWWPPRHPSFCLILAT